MEGATVLLRVEGVVDHEVGPDRLFWKDYKSVLVQLDLVEADHVLELAHLRDLPLCLCLR